MPHDAPETASRAPAQTLKEPVHTPGGPIYFDILDMIGRTPLLEVKHLDTGPCRLFLKMELLNPAGSIKDRIGLWMIRAAEADGRIDPTAEEPVTLVEGTAGNTGLALALVAAQRGYRLIVVVPDKMAQGKIRHLRAMGARVHLTRSDVQKGHPEYYQDVAERIARETPNSLYINQFANPDNAAAHAESTAPEILAQVREAAGRDLDAFICGVGSGGTLTGFAQCFKLANPDAKLVLADPKGSILEPLVSRGEHVDAGAWRVEGMGEDFIPPVCDIDEADEAIAVSDHDSFAAARELLLKEGILSGSSTGCLLAAALDYCRRQTEPKIVVTLACDHGAKYLDKVFSEPYLLEEGLSDRETFGDLRDLIPLLHERGEDPLVKPADSVEQAYKTLRLHNVSALPVIDPASPDALLGEFAETDVLAALAADPDIFKRDASSVMTPSPPTLPASASRDELAAALAQRPHAYIIDESGAYLGLVPRSMLLSRAMHERKA